MTGPAQRLAHRLPFYYGWVVLYFAATTQVVRNSAASLTIAVFMIPLADDLGWLVDRYGARQVLAASVFIMGLSTIALAWATVPVAFYIAYGISRVIFASPVPIGASVVVSRWFVRMRGKPSLHLSFKCGNGLLSGAQSVLMT